MKSNRNFKLTGYVECGLASTTSAGRSMIEMLGVLAIIGVLSIGGLAGYSKAMTYHRANTILSDAQLAYAWIAGIEEIDEGEHKPAFIAQSGKEIYAFRTISGDDFVKIVGVEESTCERLLKMQADKLHIYEGNSKMTACSETNAMTFGFNQYAPDGTSTGGSGNQGGGNNAGDNTPTTPTCGTDETLLNGSCCLTEKVCGTGDNKVCCVEGECNAEGKCCQNETCCDAGEVPNTMYGTTVCCSSTEFYYYGGCFDCSKDLICNGTATVSCPDNKVLVHTVDSYHYACCAENQYYEHNLSKCSDCPQNAVCNGNYITSCTNGYVYTMMSYSDGATCCHPTQEWSNFETVEGGWRQVCRSCPENAVCDGSPNVTCLSGSWDGQGKCE